jgi:hypothetical protein
MGIRVKSGFLFADPSFMSGAARVFDLWAQFDDYNRSDTPAEADAKAIAADWLVVGQDISDAAETCVAETESEVTAA